MKININLFNIYSSYFLIFIIIIDPANKIFKLKGIALLISLFAGLYLLMKIKKTKKEYINLLIFYFLLPNLYAGVIGLKNINFYFSEGYYTTNLFGSLFGLFILSLNHIKKQEFLRFFLKLMKIYSIFYLVIIVVFHIDLLNLNNLIYKYSLEKENMMISLNQIILGYKQYNIFYKTCPILVLYFSYLIYNKDLFSVIILFILLISGTAANILACLLILLFWILSIFLKKSNINKRIILFILICLLGILFFKDFIFSGEDKGNSIKYGHLIGYIEFWSMNTKDFLLGSGLGSGFYSFGKNRILFNTELTYFEIIKNYGVVISGFIFLFLIQPLLKLIKIKKLEWLFISYLAYLFIGGTNPLILGSTGALILMLVYKLTF